MILSHFSAVSWLNVSYIATFFKLIVNYKYLVHAMSRDISIVCCLACNYKTCSLVKDQLRVRTAGAYNKCSPQEFVLERVCRETGE